jgi:hypothetical protein
VKVIFLDVDGVLNGHESQWRVIPECVRLLNEIVERTGAKLVLSSSWRLLSDWEPAVREYGVTGEFVGVTRLCTTERFRWAIADSAQRKPGGPLDPVGILDL